MPEKKQSTTPHHLEIQDNHGEQDQDKAGIDTAHDAHCVPNFKQVHIGFNEEEQEEENCEQSISHGNNTPRPLTDKGQPGQPGEIERIILVQSATQQQWELLAPSKIKKNNGIGLSTSKMRMGLRESLGMIPLNVWYSPTYTSFGFLPYGISRYKSCGSMTKVTGATRPIRSYLWQQGIRTYGIPRYKFGAEDKTS